MITFLIHSNTLNSCLSADRIDQLFNCSILIYQFKYMKPVQPNVLLGAAFSVCLCLVFVALFFKTASHCVVLAHLKLTM